MPPQRKWTKEKFEAYLALHPDLLVKEIAADLGLSSQRVYQIFQKFDIKLPGTTEEEGPPPRQAAHIRQNAEERRGEGTQSQARLILVSPCSNDELIEAIRKGATPYLAREVDREETGQLTPDNFMPANARKDSRHHLTRREVEILHYVANGSTHAQLAAALGIAEKTVKSYMTSIYRKLGANNKAHATALALQCGLLSLDDIAPSPNTRQNVI